MIMSSNNMVGAYEAKTRFSELLERVKAGEEITITRHGTPVAKLVPYKTKTTPEWRRTAIDRWRERSKGITLGGLEIRDLIEEGRR
ncbi:MAG TPA: type II toxin-antitoxin system prevent-host-death family antitoxin [Tepidisphaeraceae bacterium]|jgi:prevent-host-death family protein